MAAAALSPPRPRAGPLAILRKHIFGSRGGGQDGDVPARAGQAPQDVAFSAIVNRHDLVARRLAHGCAREQADCREPFLRVHVSALQMRTILYAPS